MAKKRSSTDLMTIEDALVALQIDRAGLDELIQSGELTAEGEMLVSASVQALLNSPDVEPQAEPPVEPVVAANDIKVDDVKVDEPRKEADFFIFLRIPLKRVLQQANRPPKHAAVQRLKEWERDVLGHWVGGVMQEDALYLNDEGHSVPIKNFQGLVKGLIQAIKAQLDAATQTEGSADA